MHLLTQTLLFIFIPLIFSQFVSDPANPKVGESIFLKCRLNAPDGHKFLAITPELKVNGSSPFTCDRLFDEMGNSDFHGAHDPDYGRTNLSCDIVIFFFEESYFGITFTCFQELDDHTVIEYNLTLERYSTYATYQTTSLETSTLVATTLAPLTLKSFVTPEYTDSTPIGMSNRGMMIALVVLVCFILLCLASIVCVPLISFISFGLYLLCRSSSPRITQYSFHDPEVPKSKKEAINEQPQETSHERQTLSSPERGQEENPQTDSSPLELSDTINY